MHLTALLEPFQNNVAFSAILRALVGKQERLEWILLAGHDICKEPLDGLIVPLRSASRVGYSATSPTTTLLSREVYQWP